MSDAVADSVEEPVKSGKKPLILALLLALIGGGGGFYAVYSGLILAPATETEGGESPDHEGTGHDAPVELPDVAFVEVDPITISLNDAQSVQFLRFRAQLEVDSQYEQDVEAMLPRVTDILNSYLRALELDDLRDPLALTRLRAQMLRRVQVVVGKNRVRDLLIMEFVLN